MWPTFVLRDVVPILFFACSYSFVTCGRIALFLSLQLANTFIRLATITVNAAATTAKWFHFLGAKNVTNGALTMSVLEPGFYKLVYHSLE